MFFLVNSFRVSLCCCIVRVLGFIFGAFSRSSGEVSEEVAPDLNGVPEKETPEEGTDENVSGEIDSDQIGRRVIPKMETEVGSLSSASTSKYQFSSGNSVYAFIEEPQTMRFTVQEMFVIHHDQPPNGQGTLENNLPSENEFLEYSANSNDSSPSHELVVDSCSSERSYCIELNGEDEVMEQGKTESSVCGLIFQEEDALGDVEHEFSDIIHSPRNSSEDFWASIHKYDDFSSRDDEDDEYGSDSDEMLCDKRVDCDEDSPRLLDDILFDKSSPHLGDASAENEDETAEPQSLSSVVHVEEHIPEDEFSDSDDELDLENSTFEDSKGVDASKKCDEEKHQTGEDVMLEQKELIRQMKREMRHLKISGLPTILEESESPRVEDDLRPLKIDERIGHKDRMDEIQTLYRMYLDKMRRLDILSQQTMYAIGLLQLKNQDELASSKKVSVPVIKSLLAQNFWSYKLRKHEADPIRKLIRDFQRDLELVYVGQICLSWETLKWLHYKAEQLHAHDPDGFRQHNQVAGEFQKFQVLLQRFTEDEPFHHGPRVQHYVKTRCALPNLLQVPLIKDDPKSEWRGKAEGGISVGMLKEIIGASMRAFWDFLRADKDEVNAMTLMGIHGHHVELQDPLDSELLLEIRLTLQKKEKRLKDLLKSGNCIVKKLQKHRDHQLSHEMFLGQVELRLVSRVLNMSRLTTDQLLWCHKKISKINFVGRKIYLEPSFLLFPC